MMPGLMFVVSLMCSFTGVNGVCYPRYKDANGLVKTFPNNVCTGYQKMICSADGNTLEHTGYADLACSTALSTDLYDVSTGFVNIGSGTTQIDCDCTVSSSTSEYWYIEQTTGTGCTGTETRTTVAMEDICFPVSTSSSIKVSCSNSSWVSSYLTYSDANCTTPYGSTPAGASPLCVGNNYKYTCVTGGAEQYVSPSSSDGSDDNKNDCFAGGSSVTTKQGEKLIEDVQIGDEILVSSSSDFSTTFAPVVFIPHPRNSKRSKFIHISTKDQSSLKVTPAHLVFASVSCEEQTFKAVAAKDLTAGMCVMGSEGPEIIDDLNETEESSGIYTVVSSHTDGI